MPETRSQATHETRRSRKGCQACRKRHRKCDEAKPACAYCADVRQPCVYTQQLYWGGRSFSKSRFGKCLATGATAINASSSGNTLTPVGFVYGTLSQSAPVNVRLEASPTAAVARIVDVSVPSSVQQLDECDAGIGEVSEVVEEDATEEVTSLFDVTATTRILSMTPTVLPHLRPLLDYFVHRMTKSTPCHQGIQERLCSTFVPMALNVSHLLSAVLTLAAAHHQSIGLDSGDGRLETM
ncbi:hypothetical protein BU16DRAFT_526621 [Lophium mytilinum]|uniref:Zn(2)-C6 fungal-type domain-containing protein n=1 Tax=Lophium mytilinum TaxID=390894 RepID=A0A6A6QV72_9PEZI|nr:hypothetical protein BU16DRAFT_526621 [Lophium mytilinum]